MKHAILAAILLLVLGGSTVRALPATPAVDPSTFSTNVTNPYFSLPIGAVRIYEGEETDPDTGETHRFRVEETVLAELAEVMGVPVVVLQVREFEDGKLIEATRDYHAQHEDGSVWYFGEDVDNIEDGVVVDHNGSWLAGEGDNQPSPFMPADPQPFDTIPQEQAPGLAEDISTVVQTDLSVQVAAGAFAGCIWTVDVNPLEVTSEFKTYCPGPGLVREENAAGVIELVSITLPKPATPAA
ncbi:MAG: hypothetical protein R2855_19705 [Thermomicrobiales bacterium]